MSKSDPAKERNKTIRWVVTVFLVTIAVSGFISLISDEIMSGSGIVTAFAILLIIVLIGIVFDIVGVAVTSAHEKPFHSMAARKVPGAQDAIRLLRNAERVSSICCDVVGDICGVVSGSASAVIAVKALSNLNSDAVGQLIMSALVAGITIAGKALGKNIAMRRSTQIVHLVSKPIYYIKSLFRSKKRRKRK